MPRRDVQPGARALFRRLRQALQLRRRQPVAFHRRPAV